MRLVLAVAAIAAAAMELTHGQPSLRSLATSYPKCTAASTKFFVDNLATASSGCAASTGYSWDGDADPTDAQREALCKCTIAAFDVPKCAWTKQGQYVVSASEHFNYVYNCAKSSGKATPKVTEVDAASATSLSSTAPTSSAADTCTKEQLATFATGLQTASSGCLSDKGYNWGGSSNPSDAQLAEICKCSSVKDFAIPSCSVTKGADKVALSEHYKWIMSTKCPATAASSSGGAGTTAKNASTADAALCTEQQVTTFTGNLKTASEGCLTDTGYNWGGEANPTEEQTTAICKCTSVQEVKVPSCAVKKGTDAVSLLEHYKWATVTQCPTAAPAPAAATSHATSQFRYMHQIACVVAGLVAVSLW